MCFERSFLIVRGIYFLGVGEFMLHRYVNTVLENVSWLAASIAIRKIAVIYPSNVLVSLGQPLSVNV